jgi:hypothetical protein
MRVALEAGVPAGGLNLNYQAGAETAAQRDVAVGR